MLIYEKKNKSKCWIHRHLSDKYVKLSYQKGFRSRSIFKLKDLNNSDKLFTSGMTVVDLGSAPGSWSEYAAKKIGKYGKVVACDVLPMLPIKNVHFIQGDVRDEIVLYKILNYLEYKSVNVLMSDMAPNISGYSAIDIPKFILLCELVLNISNIILIEGGTLLIKLFQGEGFEEYLKKVCTLFSSVHVRKPNSSRSNSKEIFIVAAKKKKITS
ncbi:SAM-dependent methyltransferase [Buchnera aphidicola (Formosaphis micheliae)]|uniref:RlmE family RNA methyltransferase n=1 Tax=Buchnera aphidicola TaxID=9 RepID=UPI0031CC9E8B